MLVLPFHHTARILTVPSAHTQENPRILLPSAPRELLGGDCQAVGAACSENIVMMGFVATPQGTAVRQPCRASGCSSQTLAAVPRRGRATWRCSATMEPDSAHQATGEPDLDLREGRKEGIMRLAIPSKGGMAEETKALLKSIGMDVIISNPRQYVAKLKGVEDLEVWLQRPSDIARKVSDGDVDLGITGFDLIAEYATNADEILTVHEDLGFGRCRLGVGVPISWTHIRSLDDLIAAFQDRPEPLRVATKFNLRGAQFFAEKGFSNYRFVYMDGALEASTQMGTADVILDLISSGVTLRENLLKELDDGVVLQSTMQLVANKRELKKSPALLAVARELLERIEAHIHGEDQYNLIANIRGASPGEVARKLAKGTVLRGMDGPTISMVIPPQDAEEGMYAIGIVIPKRILYRAVQELRSIGGSGVCVLPVTYVFELESQRWKRVEEELSL